MRETASSYAWIPMGLRVLMREFLSKPSKAPDQVCEFLCVEIPSILDYLIGIQRRHA